MRNITIIYIEILLQVVVRILFCTPVLYQVGNNIRSWVDSIQPGINLSQIPVYFWLIFFIPILRYYLYCITIYLCNKTFDTLIFKLSHLKTIMQTVLTITVYKYLKFRVALITPAIFCMTSYGHFLFKINFMNESFHLVRGRFYDYYLKDVNYI